MTCTLMPLCWLAAMCGDPAYFPMAHSHLYASMGFVTALALQAVLSTRMNPNRWGFLLSPLATLLASLVTSLSAFDEVNLWLVGHIILLRAWFSIMLYTAPRNFSLAEASIVAQVVGSAILSVLGITLNRIISNSHDQEQSLLQLWCLAAVVAPVLVYATSFPLLHSILLKHQKMVALQKLKTEQARSPVEPNRAALSISRLSPTALQHSRSTLTQRRRVSLSVDTKRPSTIRADNLVGRYFLQSVLLFGWILILGILTVAWIGWVKYANYDVIEAIERPLSGLMSFSASNFLRVSMLSWWISVSVATLSWCQFPSMQSSQSPNKKKQQQQPLAKELDRKVFHLAAALVFIPGILVTVRFLSRH